MHILWMLTVFFVSLGSVYMVLKHRRRSDIFILFSWLISVIMYHNFSFERIARSDRNLEKNMVQIWLNIFIKDISVHIASYYGLWLHGRQNHKVLNSINIFPSWNFLLYPFNLKTKESNYLWKFLNFTEDFLNGIFTKDNSD